MQFGKRWIQKIGGGVEQSNSKHKYISQMLRMILIHCES